MGDQEEERVPDAGSPSRKLELKVPSRGLGSRMRPLSGTKLRTRHVSGRALFGGRYNETPVLNISTLDDHRKSLQYIKSLISKGRQILKSASEDDKKAFTEIREFQRRETIRNKIVDKILTTDYDTLTRTTNTENHVAFDSSDVVIPDENDSQNLLEDDGEQGNINDGRSGSESEMEMGYHSEDCDDYEGVINDVEGDAPIKKLETQASNESIVILTDDESVVNESFEYAEDIQSTEFQSDTDQKKLPSDYEAQSNDGHQHVNNEDNDHNMYDDLFEEEGPSFGSNDNRALKVNSERLLEYEDSKHLTDILHDPLSYHFHTENHTDIQNEDDHDNQDISEENMSVSDNGDSDTSQNNIDFKQYMQPRNKSLLNDNVHSSSEQEFDHPSDKYSNVELIIDSEDGSDQHVADKFDSDIDDNHEYGELVSDNSNSESATEDDNRIENMEYIDQNKAYSDLEDGKDFPMASDHQYRTEAIDYEKMSQKEDELKQFLHEMADFQSIANDALNEIQASNNGERIELTKTDEIDSDRNSSNSTNDEDSDNDQTQYHSFIHEYNINSQSASNHTKENLLNYKEAKNTSNITVNEELGEENEHKDDIEQDNSTITDNVNTESSFNSDDKKEKDKKLVALLIHDSEYSSSSEDELNESENPIVYTSAFSTNPFTLETDSIRDLDFSKYIQYDSDNESNAGDSTEGLKIQKPQVYTEFDRTHLFNHNSETASDQSHSQTKCISQEEGNVSHIEHSSSIGNTENLLKYSPLYDNSINSGLQIKEDNHSGQDLDLNVEVGVEEESIPENSELHTTSIPEMSSKHFNMANELEILNDTELAKQNKPYMSLSPQPLEESNQQEISRSIHIEDFSSLKTSERGQLSANLEINIDSNSPSPVIDQKLDLEGSRSGSNSDIEDNTKFEEVPETRRVENEIDSRYKNSINSDSGVEDFRSISVLSNMELPNNLEDNITSKDTLVIEEFNKSDLFLEKETSNSGDNIKLDTVDEKTVSSTNSLKRKREDPDFIMSNEYHDRSPLKLRKLSSTSNSFFSTVKSVFSVAKLFFKKMELEELIDTTDNTTADEIMTPDQYQTESEVENYLSSDKESRTTSNNDMIKSSDDSINNDLNSTDIPSSIEHTEDNKENGNNNVILKQLQILERLSNGISGQYDSIDIDDTQLDDIEEEPDLIESDSSIEIPLNPSKFYNLESDTNVVLNDISITDSGITRPFESDIEGETDISGTIANNDINSTFDNGGDQGIEPKVIDQVEGDQPAVTSNITEESIGQSDSTDLNGITENIKESGENRGAAGSSEEPEKIVNGENVTNANRKTEELNLKDDINNSSEPIAVRVHREVDSELKYIDHKPEPLDTTAKIEELKEMHSGENNEDTNKIVISSPKQVKKKKRNTKSRTRSKSITNSPKRVNSKRNSRSSKAESNVNPSIGEGTSKSKSNKRTTRSTRRMYTRSQKK
ncbi:Hypothetical protein J6898_01397 [Nakaseomyces glabratus]|nr:hypothetical protein LTX96_0001243 [Nakaseomyces glabratus]